MIDPHTSQNIRAYLENKGVRLWNKVETTKDEVRRMPYSEIVSLYYKALHEYECFCEFRSEILDLLSS